MPLEDQVAKCVHYLISRNQRWTEVARGEPQRNTKGYEDMGCYACEGYNKDCEAYEPGRKQ